VSGHLAGAAVDVFSAEPKGCGDEFVSELRGLPNVILTPHIGGSTEEAQSNIGDFVANKLANFVKDGDTTLSVNLPEQPGISRVTTMRVGTPDIRIQVPPCPKRGAVRVGTAPASFPVRQP
jgi:D-3-phosphoglycerate dehydrogenase